MPEPWYSPGERKNLPKKYLKMQLVLRSTKYVIIMKSSNIMQPRKKWLFVADIIRNIGTHSPGKT